MSFTLTSKIPQLTAQIKRDARALVVKTAARIETTARLSMAEPKSGQVYKHRGKDHQAAAPGESPAVRDGFLSSSIQAEQTGEASAVVGSNMEYAAVQEFGGANMPAHPFLGPAFEEAAESFEKGVKELLK
jgi:HK97 gp10 family phage protein